MQLPTGYGKTLTAAAAFHELWKRGDVTHLLYIVPTAAQLSQFCDGGQEDFIDAGLSGVVPFDVGYSPTQAITHHRKNTRVVFAVTIQALVSGAAGMAVRELLQSGSWMIVVDEHHHYGIDKAWGVTVRNLPCRFMLAMSATPERRNQDGAFGKPPVTVTYREAQKEGAVKKMILHSYEYRVDAITVNGEPVSFSTSDVTKAVGSDDPRAIDKYVVDNKLRWSPKYISPLVSIPLERLLARRGGYPLQMIVGAMGCLHAKMVCEQIHSMFGDLLRVDWVGTGPNGRSDGENESVIRKFCPSKVDGKRRAEDVGLDILVHVGMAGEGLDSVFVAEVVHLNGASISNQNHQENGRGARFIDGITCFINVDSSSPYAAWSGERIMDCVDHDGDAPPVESDDGATEGVGGNRDASELPKEPLIVIADCQLENIDKGDPEVMGCAEAILKGVGLDDAQIRVALETAMADPEHQIWAAAVKHRRMELLERARSSEGMSVLYQLRKSVSNAVGAVAAMAARKASTMRPERSLVGDLCKRLWSEMKKRFGGSIDKADEKGLRARYDWIYGVQSAVLTEGIPSWLR